MQKMSACEEKVMLVIWHANHLLSYKEIQTGVNERFGDSWKPETVCTFIDRLKKKSYIVPVKKGVIHTVKLQRTLKNIEKSYLKSL